MYLMELRALLLLKVFPNFTCLSSVRDWDHKGKSGLWSPDNQYFFGFVFLLEQCTKGASKSLKQC